MQKLMLEDPEVTNEWQEGGLQCEDCIDSIQIRWPVLKYGKVSGEMSSVSWCNATRSWQTFEDIL